MLRMFIIFRTFDSLLLLAMILQHGLRQQEEFDREGEADLIIITDDEEMRRVSFNRKK